MKLFILVMSLSWVAIADEAAWKQIILQKIATESGYDPKALEDMQIKIEPSSLSSLDRVEIGREYGAPSYIDGLVQWCRVEVSSEKLNYRGLLTLDRTVKSYKTENGRKVLQRGISEDNNCDAIISDLTKLKKNDAKLVQLNASTSRIVSGILDANRGSTTDLAVQFNPVQDTPARE